MRACKWIVMIVAMIGTALPAVAQVDPPGLVAKSFTIDVKPSEVLAFETALREHLVAGVAHRDPWAWHTWQVIVGQDFGQYIIRSNGHRWQEFDARADLDRLARADLMATVARHTSSISSALDMFEPAISNWPADLERPAYVAVTRFQLKVGGTRDFLAAVEKVHRAVAEREPTRHYGWLTTVSGSNGPTMMLAVPHADWSDFEPARPPLWDIVGDVYGEAEAQSIRDAIERSVSSVSDFVLMLREDLSYEPKE